MKYIYQRENLYFAQCRHGIEEIAAEELMDLGAENVSPGFSGVHFKASREVLYSILYFSKTPSRILAPLVKFRVSDEKQFYNNLSSIEWEDFLSPEKTFFITSAVSESFINNSHYASLRFKDVIADRFRKKYGKRPSVDRNIPDIRLNMNLRNNLAIVSFDLSGEPMHKRGYRMEKVKAPLNENLAAAILKISGWNGSTPIYDPMAGSGTLLAESLLQFKGLPSGFKRKRFGIFSLPDFKSPLWHQVREKFDNSVSGLPEGLISGSDIDINAVDASRKNLSMIPEGSSIVVEKRDFRDIPSLKNRMIITNLPYGKRLAENEGLGKLYREFGDFLKKRCTGSKAFLLCGSTDLVKKIGLRTKRKIPFFNGQIETRLVEIDLY